MEYASYSEQKNAAYLREQKTAWLSGDQVTLQALNDRLDDDNRQRAGLPVGDETVPNPQLNTAIKIETQLAQALHKQREAFILHDDVRLAASTELVNVLSQKMEQDKT